MGQLQAIRVGKRRIAVNHIREVEVDDYYASRDSDPAGIEVTIHFDNDTDSIELRDKEARDFLRQFDALTGIAEPETDAVAEPEAAPEIRKPVDGWISPEGFPLVIDMLEALSEISFAGFSSGRVRYYAHELHKQLVPIQKAFEAAGNPLTTNAEPVAAPETGTLRDAIPHLYTLGLEKLDDVLNKIIDSNAPVSARSEARILKQAVKREINQRFDYLKD